MHVLRKDDGLVVRELALSYERVRVDQMCWLTGTRGSCSALDLVLYVLFIPCLSSNLLSEVQSFLGARHSG